jgi:hypothetical protein
MRLSASTDASGRQQWLGLMAETVVESGRCGLALLAARGSGPNVIATG